MKTHISEVEWAARVFVVFGAINSFLAGVFSFDLVAILFGTSPRLMQLVYIVIGLSGVFWLYKMITAKK